ncbi:MAG TPA: L,D-transpeptidase [Blastocatellia bacterium]|nr:L,D-transpeptidase [Blastocatellia bacterium]
MKRNARTVSLLITLLGAPLLASALALREEESDAITSKHNLSQPQPTEPEDSISRPAAPTKTATLSVSRLGFEIFKVQNQKSIQQLESRLGPDGFLTMLKVNRIDRKHIRVGDSLLIPHAGEDTLALAPFPRQLQTAINIPKLVLVSRRVQAFGAYEHGTLVYWGPTSTGKKSTPTPAGLYHANWKAREKRSSINQSWILPWCFNLDDNSGIAFHQFDLPGYPASHGCVRLLEEDARWIFDWAEQWIVSKVDSSIVAFGTPVIIFGDYSYGEKPVWKNLVDQPQSSAISIAEAGSVLGQYLVSIEKESARRTSTRNAQLSAVSSDVK